MSYIRLLLILISIHYGNANLDAAPVFVMDYEKVLPQVTIEPNPFYRITPKTFTQVVEEAIKHCKIIILFIEEKFSTEDTSLKDNQGAPFFHLQQGLSESKIKYLPNVIEPYKTFKSMFPHQKHNVFYLSSTSTKLQIYSGRYTHFYIYFKDSGNETRINSLRRHDLIMKEVYFVIRNIAVGPVIGFYTGKMNPTVLDSRKFVSMKPAPIKRTPGVTITSTGGLFRLIGVYSTLGTRRSTFSQIPLVVEETWTRRRLNTRMAYTDFELEFAFSFKDDSWTVDSISLLEWGEEVGRTKMGVGAPWKNSYVCGEPLVLVNTRDASAVIISQYQIQPLHTNFILRNASGNSTNGTDSYCFGPAIHCGPYFNSQILASLMVTFLCIGILSYGVLILYNCKSNDRYDDPHGKQLVIISDSAH